jgi:methylated-DNA-[protein]-cysteine S-methyltransferase
VGPLFLEKSSDGLLRLQFDGDPRPDSRADAKAFRDEVDQLAAYFAGDRDRFDLALAPRGTPFQLRVWKALQKIPFGRTATYGEIARAIGSPTASRAVGGANHMNPLAIIVPCHRVIGSTGDLTGYGGGLPTKRWLLDHESRHLRRYAEMIGTPSCVST